MALRPVLDLDLLRTLLFIAEEGSFTKAAEMVGRTQSAITLQIQKLELQVGHPVLLRSKGGPVELTPQGRILADAARRMLQLNDDAFRDLAALNPRPTLRVGVSDYYRPFFLEAALASLKLPFPTSLLRSSGASPVSSFPRSRIGCLMSWWGRATTSPGAGTVSRSGTDHSGG
jgi:DNA-binding transcriptional LysR family regulator